MLAWSEGTDNGRRRAEIMDLWRHCRRKAITDYSDHPRKLVTLNPKLKSTGAGRYQLLSRWWMPTASSSWKTSKSQDAVALQQIEAWRFLPVVDRDEYREQSWWAISGLHCGRWLWSVRAWADSLIAKFKEAGGTVREIDVWAESPRLSPLRSYLLHHRLPVMGC